MRVLVIGGNPAGMSAASRIKRKSPDTEVWVLEKTEEVSYGACGLPYYVAGINDDIDLIRIRKKAEFEASGIHVQLGREAVSADFRGKFVTARLSDGGRSATAMTSWSLPAVPPLKRRRFRELG